MTAWYESHAPEGWQASGSGNVWSDAAMGTLAISTVIGVWLGWSAVLGVALGICSIVAAISPRRRVTVFAAVGLMLVGGLAGERAWAGAEPRAVGAFDGWAVLVSDPAPVGRGVGVVIEIAGERFQTYAYGSPRRRLERRQAGDLVLVVGRRAALPPDDRRARVRHVVGRFTIERVTAWTEGAPLARASNRLRARLRQSAEASMHPDDAALFTGLVVGDDVRQPQEVIDRFRAVGLSHLTAVSGQNVAYVIAVAGVALRRLRPWWRLGATWALIAWFVVLTRVEPSVVRAGTMAGLSALAFALGRDRSVPRILAITVSVLVLVDPLLVWSVGFWLSCGATAGVSVVGPWLAERWRGPAWLAVPVGTTVGAQLGVVVPSVLVFDRMPALGVVVNLLAVPVAGAVMLVGIPCALVASWTVPVVMVPAALGTRWVAAVAELAERLAPTGGWVLVAWSVQLGLALWWWRWWGRPRAA